MVKDQSDLSLWGEQTDPEHGTVSYPGAHFSLLIMDPAEFPRVKLPQTCTWEEGHWLLGGTHLHLPMWP